MDESVRVDGMLHLGDVPALLEDDLACVGQCVPHVAGEGGRYEWVLVPPDEQGRGLQVP